MTVLFYFIMKLKEKQLEIKCYQHTYVNLIHDEYFFIRPLRFKLGKCMSWVSDLYSNRHSVNEFNLESILNVY